MAPKGHSTRPTGDRARQALFNILEHAPWSPGLSGLRTLDLFAGSGALGLEAVSRGAAFCLFADADPAAAAAIAANIAALRLEDRCAVHRWDATTLSPRASSPIGRENLGFDLAFLDPPYGAGLVDRALASLVAGHWLDPDALVVAERGEAEPAPAAPSFEVIDNRAWGAARVWFLRYEPVG